MADTWISDFGDFLTPQGEIEPQTGPAKQMAEHFAKIIAKATVYAISTSSLVEVPCRRRPARKPCTGKIETHINDEDDGIVWCCPVCGDKGVIYNWQGSQWDHSHEARL